MFYGLTDLCVQSCSCLGLGAFVVSRSVCSFLGCVGFFVKLLLIKPAIICNPTKALEIKPAHNSGTNKFLFCVFLFPHKKTVLHSFHCHLPPLPFLFAPTPPFPYHQSISFTSFAAALLPNSVACHS